VYLWLGCGGMCVVKEMGNTTMASSETELDR
jgi:hypothetical protein